MRISDWSSDVCSSDLVVEIASPELGAALLGRQATRYVATGALVTNMAVHFKWGRESSLAWVPSLDSGKPVAGADIRVTDSCTGRQPARGTADKAGRLPYPTGLPAPEPWSRRGTDPAPPASEGHGIGGAPGRERVCQYVCIAVVAESIKKQQ